MQEYPQDGMRMQSFHGREGTVLPVHTGTYLTLDATEKRCPN